MMMMMMMMMMKHSYLFFYSPPFMPPLLILLLYSCPYRDDRYQTALKLANNVEFPSHYQRFVFKMFTFVDQGSASNTKGVLAPFLPLREKVMLPT